MHLFFVSASMGYGLRHAPAFLLHRTAPHPQTHEDKNKFIYNSHASFSFTSCILFGAAFGR